MVEDNRMGEYELLDIVDFVLLSRLINIMLPNLNHGAWFFLYGLPGINCYKTP